MDDIGARLSAVVAKHGAEALAVSTVPVEHATDNGAARRFMNLLGSPNWISGVALCAGNTAAINRMVYGWFPFPDYSRRIASCCSGTTPSALLDAVLQLHPRRAGARRQTDRAGPAQERERRARRPLAAATRRHGRGHVPGLGERHHRGGAVRPRVRRKVDRWLRRAEERVAEYPAGARGGDHRRRCRTDPPGGADVRDDEARGHPLDADHRPAGLQHLGDSPALHPARDRPATSTCPAAKCSPASMPGIIPESRAGGTRRSCPTRRRRNSSAPTRIPRSRTAAPRRWQGRPSASGATKYAEHRPRQLHGQSAGRVPRHGPRHAVPGQGVLLAGQQHADGLRQHEAHPATR